MGLRGGGGVEKHCTRASLRSDTVEDLIRLSVEGSSLEDVDAYLSCRIVLQIKNFMLTRLLVSHLLVNIAYIKIWVHLTFVPVHLRKKVRRTSAPSAKS